MTKEELEEFIDGFLTGLPIREDHKKLIKCLDDEIGPAWTRVMGAISKQEWDEPLKVYTAVILILEPSINTLMVLQNCSTGEVLDYIKKIKEATAGREKFIRKINENLAEIVKRLVAISGNWIAKKYKIVGKGVGQFVNFLVT